LPTGLDNISYRIGFEDAMDVVFGMISANDKVPPQAKEDLHDFILKLRQAKADNIVADIEIYREAVVRFVGRKPTERHARRAR